MIAEAVKAKGFKNVSVDIQTIRFTDHEARERYIYLTPPKAQLAILQFDEGVKPKPFRFWLRNCQVIPMQTMTPERKEKIREGRAAQLAKNAAVGKKKSLLGLEKLKPTVELVDKEHGAVRVKGGKPMRVTHVGRRRVFGLRELVGKPAKATRAR